MEAAFAVAEVELPQAHEAVAVAELAHFRAMAEKSLAPEAQRARVVRADVFEMKYLQIRATLRSDLDSACTDGMKLPGNT